MLNLTSYYEDSYHFLNQWKVVEIPDKGIYEVYLHPVQHYLKDADEVIQFPVDLNTERKVQALKESILSAASGAKTYISINTVFFLIEAEVLETKE